MSEPQSAVDVTRLVIYGEAAPQGSKNAIPIYRNGEGGQKEFTGQVVLLESAKEGVDAWRVEVKKAAKLALEQERNRVPFLGAVSVGMGFTMKRGKTVTRPLPSVRPDISKLIRSTEDAITDSGLWGDDGLVVAYHWLEMVYAGDVWLSGERRGLPALDRPGVLLEITALEPNPAVVTKKRAKRPVAAPASVPSPRALRRAPARSGLRGPVTPVEPSPALLEALRASGADPDASPWA